MNEQVGRQLRVEFISSHVDGDFSGGLLTVGIQIEDDALGQTTWDEIEFAVPLDFHTHNDAVAAALMTLAGRKYQEVEFNFPISPFCVETLRAYYGEIDIGPIDPAREPRRPGRRLAVNFSGGIDSVAVWQLLRKAHGGDFAVVTSEYGRGYEFERRGYESYRRDVSCRTNLRRRRFDREGRFHFCVPLLFADYLDLGGIVTGHGMAHSTNALIEARQGARYDFPHGDLVVKAGGLSDIHLLRPLLPPGILKALMGLGPERIEAAMSASSPPNGMKAYLNALMLGCLYQDARLPVPSFLDRYEDRPVPFTGDTFCKLYLLKREGIARLAARGCHFPRALEKGYDGLALDFLDRYNPCIVDLLEEPLRSRAIKAFNACGIEPYDERDWDEIGVVRRVLRVHVPRYQNLPA